ncbi:hypothetical protein KSS87_020686, partial [Heliosperma pusillum]
MVKMGTFMGMSSDICVFKAFSCLWTQIFIFLIFRVQFIYIYTYLSRSLFMISRF